jgi:hypothetical protein
MAEPTSNPPWRNRPGVWFSLLVHALASHDFERAAEARRNLDRLGVSVQFRSLLTFSGDTADSQREVSHAG